MSFLYPLFLFALFALAIPVFIHLFNFKRYKTLYFSNVQLLKLIRQESRKKSKLKQLLILLSRLLAFSSLVFAFSQPYIPLSNRTSNAGRQIVTIYIDNTFSMKAEGEKGQLLEQAKQKAIEIANLYRAGTQFFILTSDFSPQQQFALSKEQLIQQVAGIKESPRSPKTSEVYDQVVQFFSAPEKNAEKVLYFLSDFQKNSVDIESIKPNPFLFTYLIPFRSEKTNNLLIDSCWFEVPSRKIGQQEKLFVRIKNYSDQAYQKIPVRLIINDSLKAISNIQIGSQEQSVLELNYTNNSKGIQLCKIELDDYPILYDNTYFLSYLVSGKLHALGIRDQTNNSPDYLRSLFSNDELVTFDEFPENNVQIAQLRNYQCIFLVNNQNFSSGLINELVSFVDNGGSLVIFPNRVTSVAEYNGLIRSLKGNLITSADTASVGISEINYTHELYRNVFNKPEKEADLPVIHGYLSYNDAVRSDETSLLKFSNGHNALSVHVLGQGLVYSFAFSLDKKNFNFVRHVIFVPTIYNMVLNSGGLQKYAYTTENNEPVILDQNSKNDQLRIINLRTKEEYLAETRTIGSGKKQLILDQLPREAGHYLVEDDNQIIQSISFNYPRKESVPEFFGDKELEKMISSNKYNQFKLFEPNDAHFSETLHDLNNGKQLWKYFIISTILFLFCEMAIIRFWK